MNDIFSDVKTRLQSILGSADIESVVLKNEQLSLVVRLSLIHI